MKSLLLSTALLASLVCGASVQAMVLEWDDTQTGSHYGFTSPAGTPKTGRLSFQDEEHKSIGHTYTLATDAQVSLFGEDKLKFVMNDLPNMINPTNPKHKGSARFTRVLNAPQNVRDLLMGNTTQVGEGAGYTGFQRVAADEVVSNEDLQGMEAILFAHQGTGQGATDMDTTLCLGSCDILSQWQQKKEHHLRNAVPDRDFYALVDGDNIVIQTTNVDWTLFYHNWDQSQIDGTCPSTKGALSREMERRVSCRCLFSRTRCTFRKSAGLSDSVIIHVVNSFRAGERGGEGFASFSASFLHKCKLFLSLGHHFCKGFIPVALR